MKVYDIQPNMFGDGNLPRDPPRAEMVILLKPLFTVSRWFGVFPLELNLNDPDRALYQEKCSFNYVRSVIVFIIVTTYILFHLCSIATSIWIGLGLVDIIGQSLWFQGSTLSYLVSIMLLRSPQPLINLYTKDWRAVEKDCGKVFTAPNVRRFTRNCFMLYSALGIASAVLVGQHSFQVPLYPAYVLHYVHIYYSQNSSDATFLGRNWGTDQHNFSTVELAVHTACQTWFLLWKWIGSAMLDVSLCLYGYVIGVAMDVTLNQVNVVVEDRNKGIEEEQLFCQETKDIGICPKGRLLNTVVAASGDEVTAAVIIADAEKEAHLDTPQWNHYSKPVPQDEYSERMMGLLHEFQQLSQLVTDVNKATGPLLFVEFGQLILMICALVFLPIKYSQEFEWRNSVLFAGNALVFTLRLIMLTICLGDVYPAGVEVNLRIAKFMIAEPKRLDPAVFHPIMGHLSVFSANPISFNAWGFFPITRGTLLASLSVISTYIVVLLQVK